MIFAEVKVGCQGHSKESAFSHFLFILVSDYEERCIASLINWNI